MTRKLLAFVGLALVGFVLVSSYFLLILAELYS